MADYQEIFKRKRLALGLSQVKLAKAVGVTQPFINEIEKGKRSPSIEVFFKICEVLEIRVFPDEDLTEE
ncbi:helix-turn-helix transcriptional regulator [Clostridium sp. D33t1_170424_F3]|uniref:helix-turn-helix transcriptional regulator n=1 Tax=Clostridium sp. D33t1_170424_F3 TaxID=2787099 RepID=UPI0018AA3DF7|nr:helix-turn-helix transcriptional regulator [Clostridium sp. D33t1_170424_F3]